MEFNQINKVVQLCSTGMELEGQGKLREAGLLFVEAWSFATTDFEKFTAAHYVARIQHDIAGKLQWDQVALLHALKIEDESIKETLPSLYLNIGKCYEDLNDFENAKTNYQTAHSFVNFLPEDGYGKMIKSGIIKGLERIENHLDAGA